MLRREVIPLKGELKLSLSLPGSKSITNRAFAIAALAKGKSRIYGALQSDDTKVMLGALEKLGIAVNAGRDAILIKGGRGQFKSGALTIDVGASGTTTRFLTALLVLRKGKTTLKGTKRMMERPMKDLEDALAQLKGGAQVIKIRGDKSSQFLSALLMISPLVGPLKIEVQGKLVSKPYIDTTLAVMRAFGVRVKNNAYESFEIKAQEYRGTDYYVEGDASAASYFSALNFLHGGHLEFENLNYKKSIQGDVDFPEALKQLRKRSPRVIDMEAMPDTALTLACVAPFVKGETKITGLSTLRLKETDRLVALEAELKKVGVKVRKSKDFLAVGSLEFGVWSKKRAPSSQLPTSNSIKTYDDHRMAMSFAVLGTMVPGIVIEDPGCTAKTYPKFWKDLERAYLRPMKLGQKHLVLIGMRASGKSMHGKKIAKLLGRKFVDMDAEIEKEEGMSIEEVVREKGWSAFRKVEQKMCSKIYSKFDEPLVVAAGGGVVLDDRAMKALKRGAVTAFIYADPDRLASRLAIKSGKRPSLTGKKLAEEVYAVWRERQDLYLKYADHIWDDTSGDQLERWYKHGGIQ